MDYFVENTLQRKWSMIFCFINFIGTFASQAFITTVLTEFYWDFNYLMIFLGLLGNHLFALITFVYLVKVIACEKYILKILNEGIYFIRKMPKKEYEDHMKLFSIRVFLRYLSVVTDFYMTYLSPKPAKFVIKLLSKVITFMFYHILQLCYETYQLLAVFTKIKAEQLLNCVKQSSDIEKEINKVAMELIMVEKYKKHLECFYSLVALPFFASIFVCLNASVSKCVTTEYLTFLIFFFSF